MVAMGGVQPHGRAEFPLDAKVPWSLAGKPALAQNDRFSVNPLLPNSKSFSPNRAAL